jgi:hypothetical protein
MEDWETGGEVDMAEWESEDGRREMTEGAFTTEGATMTEGDTMREELHLDQ